jgi:glycosyltransferase involved in cell wall biosynthesis
MADRPRILHLRVVGNSGGGPEKTIFNSPRFIRPLGFDAMAAYMHPPDDKIRQMLVERARKNDCPLFTIEDYGIRDWRTVWRVLQLCREQKIDILQCHDYKSNSIGLVVRLFWKCHLATMLHGWTDMSGRTPIYKKVDYRCIPWYEAAVCVADDLVDSCRQMRVPDRRIHLVYNAIDTEDSIRTLSPADAKLQLLKQLGLGSDPQARKILDENALLIGSVARLSDEKRFPQLVSIFSKVARSINRPLHLWIAGEGPDRSAIEAAIREVNMGSSVRLLGLLSPNQLFYQALDLFVLNSIREGLPNVLLEAMAYGAPVAATNVNAVPALVQDKQTGWLVDAEDPRAMQDAILEAIQEPSTAARLAIAGRQHIEQNFSFQKRMERMASIYRQLLSKDRRWHHLADS